jgi:hypothetical protein
MRIYIPVAEGSAVYWANILSSVYEEAGSNSLVLRHYRAFHRRKDAIAFMEDMNREMRYPHRYKIVAFDSQEAK